MKVLVTGVNGQLGYDVVKELEKRGHEAIGVDRKRMDLTSTQQIKECIENGLLAPRYILAGENTTSEKAILTTLTFELHNGASTYDNFSLTINVSCHIQTTNYQTVLFADGNATNFDKIIDDVNTIAGKTVVLTAPLITSSYEYTIYNDCTIDLCGQQLTLGANINIAEGVTVKLIDSRGTGSVTGAGQFVLDSVDSFIELEATLPSTNLYPSSVSVPSGFR